tara:strand:- start:1041 stop:1853 length:813 start_codon:yes stop_codon:yes gene_type:complete
MKIVKQEKKSFREKILSDSKDYSLPLRSIDSFFSNVPISKSVKIKKETICTDRYFAGVVKDNEKSKFRNSIWGTCNLLGMDEKIVKKIFSIKDINQFYVGAQTLNEETGYRVYAGSYDSTKSKGTGKAVEWSGDKKYKIRSYSGHRYGTSDELALDSLRMLKDNAVLNKIVVDFLLNVAGSKNLTSACNCVKSFKGNRETIDISLDFASSTIINSKKSIGKIFNYFNHEYNDYYKFFMPEIGNSIITRCQWGLDSESNEFVNIYYMEKNI